MRPCEQGEEYVNSKTLTDVTFLVEDRPFYAHRIALLASSEAFRAMFGQVGSMLVSVAAVQLLLQGCVWILSSKARHAAAGSTWLQHACTAVSEYGRVCTSHVVISDV